MQRAIISVYDKNNILKISKFLQEKDIEIISTGGTYKYLKENNINVTEVSDITKFDEILDGRVKTLHPCIHGGILAKRDNVEHMETIKEKGIKAIDIVIVNLYPFFEKVKENLSFDEKIEFIDIGGPTMLRAAAKNFKDVIVLCDVNDYEDVMMEIEEKGDLSIEKRQYLASKVFNLMVAYNAAVSEFLNKDNFKSYLNISYKKSMDLRYGENPHQKSSYYVSTNGKGAMRNFQQLNGKELSYNNIKDMDIAWKVVWEFEEDIACCALKHNSPCGVAIGDTVLNAYKKAYECDSISIFGGIVALNRKVDKESAEEMAKIFLEIIIAPDFDEDALEILRKKKNLRIIKCLKKPEDNLEMAKVDGGILIQDRDEELINSIEVVTDKKPTEEEMKDMIFGMKVVKYVKSNAIVIVKNGTAYGIGGGQVNRIWAAQEALERAKEGSILASDAFFPFKDVVEEAAKYNIKAIIQPGGSIRDKESIEECNRRGISMVFTKMRHFKH